MKLVRLLQQAHAVEIGAYHAYEGHWRSLPADSIAQNTIKAIQIDELNHKEDIRGYQMDCQKALIKCWNKKREKQLKHDELYDGDQMLSECVSEK